MKDFLNRELVVGDVAIYQATSGQSGYLTLAKVVGFTAKMVKVTEFGHRAWRADHTTNVKPEKLAIMPNNEMLRLMEPAMIQKIIDAGKMDELINIQKEGDMKDYPIEWILATLSI